LSRRLIQVHEQLNPRNDPDRKFPTKADKQSLEKALIGVEGRPLYHINLNNHSRRSLWQALIDRGANRGISGNDTIEIAGTGMYVDLCSVDDHTVKNLELIAGATVESQVSPIIIIMNQHARMIDGKTIHSSGQMEHFKVAVNEKSFSITGNVPYIELIEGYQIPLRRINGLAYMKMHAFTKEEWDTLPHVHITSETPWVPKVLDHIPPIKWCKMQPQSLTLIKESPYNQHGEYKESTPHVIKKDKKVFDAKTPTNNPTYDTYKETIADIPIEMSKSDMRTHPHNLV
jgi:hypothetical protein